MTFRFVERPGSGATSKDSATLLFVAEGITDEQTVRAEAYGRTASTYANHEGLLFRDDIIVNPRGHAVFDVDVPYVKKKKDVGSYSISFDTTGGTTTRKWSLETVDRYGDGTIPDHKQAINVQADGTVDGVEIVEAALKFSVTYTHPRGVMSMDRLRQLARKAPSVNSGTFFGFDPGEVLFVGAKGSVNDSGESTITYDFVAVENNPALTIGDITEIEKQGHDFLWVQFKAGDPTDNDGKATTQPQYAYVERVYRRENLTALLGFGG